MITDTAQRFLRAIAGTVPADRVVEVHLFSPRRQGHAETGVAVVAIAPLEAPEAAPSEAVLDVEDAPDAAAEHVSDEDELDDELPLAHEVYADEEPAADASEADGERPAISRHEVYTARYRLLIKGPDRGRWEFDCKPEGDAPLLTVETVVRGVKDRSGDEGDPERLDQVAWRAAIEDKAWATPA
ncbi:MAG: hypothetical protein HY275_09265 [Gemmatimonadetes bacterium]|nr:hypothetical protein [Gemmatimonadota bacterium]